MHEVLISIQPKWCELLASGKKTVEVRKTRPKIETPFKCYIYQTKMKWVFNLLRKMGLSDLANKLLVGRGKVIGEFICDNIEEIGFSVYNHGEYICREQSYIEQTCLTFEEMFHYLGEGYGYGWHISDLVIYDKPKELGEFWSADKCPYANEDGCTYKYHCFRAGQTKRCGNALTRPPQSWCYVEGRNNNENS